MSSITARFPSRVILLGIPHDAVPRPWTARLSFWLSRLAAGASGLLPVLVPPLLGYALIIGISPG
jgi:hypothetical protein